MKKQISIKEFNKKYFLLERVTKVVPYFEDWTNEDGDNKEKVITRIDIEFEDGTKISVMPYTNKDDMDDTLCSALKIVEFEPQTVEFKEE